MLTSARENNLLLNDFEYSQRKIVLDSVSEGIGIGAHYNCNARCAFCLGGKPKIFSLERYKDFFEPKLSSVLSKVGYVNFCGYGELLLMPEIEEFLAYVNQNLPDVNKIYTTNGIPLLNKKVLTLLTESKSVVEISLHTSRSELHQILTRMNSFEAIVSGIKELVSMRKIQGYPTISLVFLIHTLNIENLPEFVEFAVKLGVDEILCSYMVVFNPSQLKLSCFFKQELTNASFAQAEELADKLKFTIKLPPRFGNHTEPQKVSLCADPWKYFYVENEGSVIPCCYAGGHFGYLDYADFETIWNGANYKNLRYSLVEGPLHKWCRHCFRYNPENVNELRSHISFRPDIRERVLRGYQ